MYILYLVYLVKLLNLFFPHIWKSRNFLIHISLVELSIPIVSVWKSLSTTFRRRDILEVGV